MVCVGEGDGEANDLVVGVGVAAEVVGAGIGEGII